MQTTFYKCNGNKNTFIIIPYDNALIDRIKSINPARMCKNIESQSGKNIDGLITANIENNNVIMDYYNNDGTWETFCLNGMRCLSLILHQEINKTNFNIICNNVAYSIVVLNNNTVEVKLYEPNYRMRNVKINHFIGNYIFSGAKHFVIDLKDNNWQNLGDLKKISQEIRYNNVLFPDGINVNFYKIIDVNYIEVKTYEKGIEKMMPSCASGSFACAYDYSKKNNIFNEINIINDGGEHQVVFNENYKNIVHRGNAEIEYTKGIEI